MRLGATYPFSSYVPCAYIRLNHIYDYISVFSFPFFRHFRLVLFFMLSLERSDFPLIFSCPADHVVVVVVVY